MADQYISQELQSSIKDSIEAHFSVACELGARLRTSIKTDAPGSIEPLYRELRHHVDCIYLMAGDKIGLDEQIIKTTRKELDKYFNGTDSEILNFLNIFERFKTELFKKNMLKR